MRQRHWGVIRACLILCALPVVPAGISAWVQHQRVEHAMTSLNYREIDDPWAIDLDAIEDGPKLIIWVDARQQPEDFNSLAGEVYPLNEDTWDSLLPALLDAWEPGAKVIVFCDGHGCQASRQVAMRLRDEIGIEQVYYLRGGVQSLQQLNPALMEPSPVPTHEISSQP